MTIQSVPPSGRISGPNPAFEDAELVFGLVAPVGTNFTAFEDLLSRKLGRYHYEVNAVRMSRLMARFQPTPCEAHGSDEFVRLTQRMHEGSYLRQKSGKGEFLALAAASEILKWRAGDGFKKRTAHVIRSLKHPDEVRALRRIYGPGFFLIGIAVPEERRRSFLGDDKLCTLEEVEQLLQRDEHEENDRYLDEDGNNFGQRTRDTFQLADVFVGHNDEAGVQRFLDLVFGCPFFTPTKDEHAMFLAYAASLRSADLSRQVGAVITSTKSDVVAVGTNDVPRAHGGLYWADDPHDSRDAARGHDSNEKQRSRIIDDVLHRVCPEGEEPATWVEAARRKLRGSPLMDITEYGRAVHAEMEAILACTRSGVSPVGGTLYCTTFPCHNCAKHIVDAGITRVVYVEPYPKSQSKQLFDDSIRLGSLEGDGKKVLFEPFVGIGPRRFFDLFSLGLSSGTSTKKRKRAGGEKAQWHPDKAVVWAPLLPNSYLERENVAAAELFGDSDKNEGGVP